MSYNKLFTKQLMMRKVIYSLIPLILSSIYFFGWRSFVLISWVTLNGAIVEFLFERKRNNKISEAVLVTGLLYGLTLPPQTPLWIGSVGIIFGVIFGKEVFGGFGKNIFNPALVGRAFVYVSFPKALTIEWSNAVYNFPAGLGKYMTDTIDAVTSSTPMIIFRESGELTSYIKLLFGSVAGSLGETSAILIIIAGIYLIKTKTASKDTIIGVFTGFIGMTLVFNLLNVPQVPNVLFGMLSGGFLFGTVFMATDPISSPKTKEGKWIYGGLIGIVTVVIRGYALFAGGIMFAILIGNTFAPIIDEGVKTYKSYKKKKVNA